MCAEAVGCVGHIHILTYIFTFRKTMVQCLSRLRNRRYIVETPNSESKNAIYTITKEGKRSSSMHIFCFILNQPLLFTTNKIK